MTPCLRNSLVLALPLFLLACGESLDPAGQFSEVQYRVSQEGGGTFALVSMSSGGFKRRLSADTVYSPQGPIRFSIEGAPGPYFAEFCRRSGDMSVRFTADSSDQPGQVSLLYETSGQAGNCRSSATVCTQTSGGGAACLADGQCQAGEVCEKRLKIKYPPSSDDSAAQPFADPDVRFEVCVPVSGSSCSVAGDPATTIFGRVVNGSVGDIESTFLVTDETPAVYFLNTAKHNASAIFRAAADEFLQTQLFVNNGLRDTQSGTRDVILREDL